MWNQVPSTTLVDPNSCPFSPPILVHAQCESTRVFPTSHIPPTLPSRRLPHSSLRTSAFGTHRSKHSTECSPGTTRSRHRTQSPAIKSQIRAISFQSPSRNHPTYAKSRCQVCFTRFSPLQHKRWSSEQSVLLNGLRELTLDQGCDPPYPGSIDRSSSNVEDTAFDRYKCNKQTLFAPKNGSGT